MEGRAELGEDFVVVSGNIGVGKSTLVRRLADLIGSVGMLERHHENPYLKPFYDEPGRWAFHVQAGFLSLALDDYAEIARNGRRAVLERTLDEHHDVFAAELWESELLSQEEFEILRRLHDQASAQAAAVPDLLIYLRAPADTLLDRIRQRDRASEANLSLDYLAALSRRYDQFVEEWTACPVVEVDTTVLDIRRDDDLASLVSHCTAVKGESKR